MNDYISIKQILDDVLEHPLMTDLSLERAVNYAIHFIRIVGCPKIFENKISEVEIHDYRGKLPCDVDSILQVRDLSCGRVYVASTDSFHLSESGNPHQLTYKVQNSVIFTSNKEGTLEISYRAIKLDEHGFPMIPDDSSFIRALELYIKKQHFTILFDLGKINNNVYQNVQQEYAWAVGQAQNSLIRPSVDEMQSIINSLSTVIVRGNAHATGFKYNSVKENYKIHR